MKALVFAAFCDLCLIILSLSKAIFSIDSTIRNFMFKPFWECYANWLEALLVTSMVTDFLAKQVQVI